MVLLKFAKLKGVMLHNKKRQSVCLNCLKPDELEKAGKSEIEIVRQEWQKEDYKLYCCRCGKKIIGVSKQ